jgi:putative Mn2+ efflux pump MntP
MGFLTVISIAFGLAMDAFAVAIASGVTMRELRIKHAFRIAFSFGLFQALMPFIGWLTGRGVREFVAGIDHWIAFALLSIVGVRMIYEAARIESPRSTEGILGLHLLLVLSVATSIDALVVGFGFAFLGVSILLPVLVIGIVTFVLSLGGAIVGSRIGHFFERKIEILGGLILIAMGLKILIEHLIVNT